MCGLFIIWIDNMHNYAPHLSLLGVYSVPPHTREVYSTIWRAYSFYERITLIRVADREYV